MVEREIGSEAFMPFRVQRLRGTEVLRRRGREAQRHKGTKHRGFKREKTLEAQWHKGIR